MQYLLLLIARLFYGVLTYHYNDSNNILYTAFRNCLKAFTQARIKHHMRNYITYNIKHNMYVLQLRRNQLFKEHFQIQWIMNFASTISLWMVK